MKIIKSGIVDMNYFKEFSLYNDYCEELRDKCEEQISDFIDEEWNPKLEYYVECEDTNVLSIMVCDEIDRYAFEQFVINPLIRKFGLEVSYVESVESCSPYIEWGLIVGSSIDYDNNYCIKR